MNNTTANDEGTHLLDYLIILAKNGRMIILVSAAVTVLTYLVLFMLPNKYSAVARIMPPHQKMTFSAQLLNSLGGLGTPGASMGGSMGAGMAAATMLGLRSPSELYAGMMSANTISDRIIEHFHLRRLYKTSYIEDARGVLRERAKIVVDKKDGVISVVVTDTDPKRAAEIANAFSQELDKLLLDLTVQEASSRLAFLEKERAKVNDNLKLAENSLRTFSETNSVINIDTQTKGVLEYIARLRAEIDTKEVQIQVMRQQATVYNYDVVRLETEVQGLKDKLKSAETQYNEVCIGDVCLTSSKVPTLGLEYLRLYRDVKFQEGLYQFYIKMVELTRLDMMKDVSIVQLVDRALPPEKRSNKRLPTTLMAGVITFFLLSFVVIARENWDKLFKTESTISRWQQLSEYPQSWWQDIQRLFFWRRK